MTDYNIALDFDYNELKIKASVVTPGSGDLGNFSLYVYNTDGILVATPGYFDYTGHRIVDEKNALESPYKNTVNGYVLGTELDFGISCAGNGNPRTNSNFLIDSDINHGYPVLNGIALRTGSYTPNGNNILSGYSLLGSDGESCFRGRITSVTDKTRIYWSCPSGSTQICTTAAQANDFQGDLLYIYSGDGSGVYSTITSTGNGYSLDVDVDMTDYVGDSFIVYPIRTVTTYTGWSDTSVYSTFGLNKALRTGMFTQYVDISTSLIAMSDSDLYPNYVNDYLTEQYGGLAGTYLILDHSGDSWGYTPQVGDIVRYRLSSTPTLLNQVSFIYHVAGHSGTSNLVFVYPAVTHSTTPGYTNGLVYPANRFTVQSYPKFGEELFAVLRKDEAIVHVEKVRAPTASVELSASDHESVFGSVAASAHFHIGPIKLSNGTYIDSPHTKLTAALYNNDPSDGADKSWTMYGTQDYTAAVNYSGEYTRFGSFVVNYNTLFTSAQMLTMTYTLGIGRATISDVVNIPVHPAI